MSWMGRLWWRSDFRSMIRAAFGRPMAKLPSAPVNMILWISLEEACRRWPAHAETFRVVDYVLIAIAHNDREARCGGKKP